MGEKRKSDKQKMKPKKERHDDAKQDAAMMKKVVKKGCMK